MTDSTRRLSCFSSFALSSGLDGAIYMCAYAMHFLISYCLKHIFMKKYVHGKIHGTSAVSC